MLIIISSNFSHMNSNSFNGLHYLNKGNRMHNSTIITKHLQFLVVRYYFADNEHTFRPLYKVK